MLAHAQQSVFDLGIYPPVLEISANPPAVVEGRIIVQNQNENPQKLDIIFRSFRPSQAGNGQIEYLADENIAGPDPLILQKIKVYDGDLEIKKFDLDPFQDKELTLKIDLERGAPSGDYYFSVIFVTEAATGLKQSGSSVPAGIGTNVILSVGKKGATQGQISRFSAPFWLGSGPVPFTLLLKNTGDQYFIPTGRITIKDMIGRDVGRLDILPQYVLSGSQRYMVDTNQASPSANTEVLVARYGNVHNVLVWPEKFLFGVYSADVLVKLSSTGPSFKRTLHFVSFPLYIIFGISLFAFILLGIYIKVRKKTK